MSTLRIITTVHDGRILTNNNVWTADSQFLLFDTRSDKLGDVFDGIRIMQIHVASGAERCLYLARHHSNCGAVTTHPFDDRFIFIGGPEHPSDDWIYGPSHRQGLIGHRSSPQRAFAMDARDLADRPLSGALRGGTHVHVWHSDGDWIRSTYNDAIVHSSIRDISVHIPGQVDVPGGHPRNHSGTYHSFIVTDTAVDAIKPDDVLRAYEETWLGHKKQLAFMADTRVNGEIVTEIFTVDVSTLSLGSKHTLDNNRRIKPPAGIIQKRLTDLAHSNLRIAKKPRHWLVASPDGSTVAVLLQREGNPAQLYTIDVRSSTMTQRTALEFGVDTCISWSTNNEHIALGSANSIYVLDTSSWKVTRVAEIQNGFLLPLCCSFSPDSRKIAVNVRIDETNHIGYVQMGQANG